MSLKKKLLKVITAFLSGCDVLTTLPTGYGKSLCYGCLPLACDKLLAIQGLIMLIVSPLIALMKDQVQPFRKGGFSAAYDGDAECEDVKAGVLEGKYQLVFVSPEQLNDNIRNLRDTANNICTESRRKDELAHVQKTFPGEWVPSTCHQQSSTC